MSLPYPQCSLQKGIFIGPSMKGERPNTNLMTYLLRQAKFLLRFQLCLHAVTEISYGRCQDAFEPFRIAWSDFPPCEDLVKIISQDELYDR